jgi:hypothetical protein
MDFAWEDACFVVDLRAGRSLSKCASGLTAREDLPEGKRVVCP